MAAYVELYMDQGATFNNVLNINDDLTNANINLSNYIVTSQMRRSYYSSNASANIVCTVTDASNGTVTMSLAAANTALIKPGKYLFDVKINNTSTLVVTRIVEGIMTVIPSVTK